MAMIQHKQYSLLRHNTFGINATCDSFIEYGHVAELQALLQELQSNSKKKQLLHIGAGSNLLFLEDFHGVVLHSAIRHIEVVKENDKEVWVRVGAGVVWDDFVQYAIDQQWYGAENLSWIPGEVGASAVQNIGAYGVEVCELIETVETVSMSDGNLRIFTQQECDYSYRRSVFKTVFRGQYIVTAVVYRLQKEFTPNTQYAILQHIINKDFPHHDFSAAALRKTIIQIRQSKLPDPKEQGNAGSFFMNPIIPSAQFQELQTTFPDIPFYTTNNGVKIPAAWLIEQVGWKGRSLGKAGVHSKQALVLVNQGGAQGSDIKDLCTAIQTDVLKTFGIELHPEVNFISNT